MTKPGRQPSPAVRNSQPLRHRVHRLIGITTGIILVYLVATGLPLQFTSGLNLAGSYVASPTVLDWYGIPAPETGWQSGRAVHIGNLLYWTSRPVAEVGSFQGAIQLDDLVIAATGKSLIVFPADEPALLETIGLPEQITRIGLVDREIVLQTNTRLLTMDPGLLNPVAAEYQPDQIAWSGLTPLEHPALADYQDRTRARILTWERFLQDLHSGRAFGVIGEWIINLATLAMVVLSFTGLWIWWKTR